MKSGIRVGIVIAVVAALVVAAAAASCGGEETTTTQAPTTTLAAATVPSATAGETSEVAAIEEALEASGDVADGFQIADYVIMQGWAGAIVSAPMVDDARVLLKEGDAGWEVVTLFSEMSREEILGYGAPEEIAAFLGHDDTASSIEYVSPDSIAYAEGLGGTSHEGETLYVVIGASVESEDEAQRLLDDALPNFGDMQSYFIVQRSDSFDGMEPGWWVVIEAYRASPQAEQVDFARRGFPDAYVKQVTVNTADPIPVYEDMIGR